MKLRTMVVAAAILLAGGTGAAVATVPAGGVIDLRVANRVYLPAVGLERLRLGQ
jgi:hypothetical protein